MSTRYPASDAVPTDRTRATRSGIAPLRIALIDTDSGFLQVVDKRVRARGWQQRVLPGAVPVEELVELRLSALVIDLAVLGTPGWSYLEHVCAALPALPVIVCTGASTVAQRVHALRVGADDWLGKPCHPEELLARIEAIVRRGRRAAGTVERPAIEAGEIAIRPDQYQAFVGERSLDLTRREFELIRLLAEHAGTVLERETIYERVWGYAMAHGDRSVDVFVRKLRQKLERASPGWRYIHTHFGVGYRFAPAPVEPPQEAAVAADGAGVDAPGSEDTAPDAPTAPRARVLQ